MPFSKRDFQPGWREESQEIEANPALISAEGVERLQ
jgi:hypothetical protein